MDEEEASIVSITVFIMAPATLNKPHTVHYGTSSYNRARVRCRYRGRVTSYRHQLKKEIKKELQKEFEKELSKAERGLKVRGVLNKNTSSNESRTRRT